MRAPPSRVKPQRLNEIYDGGDLQGAVCNDGGISWNADVSMRTAVKLPHRRLSDKIRVLDMRVQDMGVLV